MGWHKKSNWIMVPYKHTDNINNDNNKNKSTREQIIIITV